MIWYLTEQSELVIRKKSISFIQQEISPDELLEAPVLSLDEAVGSLAFWSVGRGKKYYYKWNICYSTLPNSILWTSGLAKGQKMSGKCSKMLENFQDFFGNFQNFYFFQKRVFENVPFIFHPFATLWMYRKLLPMALVSSLLAFSKENLNFALTSLFGQLTSNKYRER